MFGLRLRPVGVQGAAARRTRVESLKAVTRRTLHGGGCSGGGLGPWKVPRTAALATFESEHAVLRRTPYTESMSGWGFRCLRFRQRLFATLVSEITLLRISAHTTWSRCLVGGLGP